MNEIYFKKPQLAGRLFRYSLRRDRKAEGQAFDILAANKRLAMQPP